MPCKAAKSLSATNLAIHHHLNCDLYIHYIYHGCKPDEVQDGTPGPYSGFSELVKAQFERGLDWERKLFKWLDDQDMLLTILPALTDANTLLTIIDFDVRDHFYIAGLAFKPPNETFEMTYARNDKTPVQFGVAKPDLLEIKRQEDGTILWRVIDAKSSKSMKTSHHVQIFFYQTCLQHLLRPPVFKPMETLGIWLPPDQDEPPSFSNIRTINSDLLTDAMKPYMFRRLPDIIEIPRQAVPWHFSPRCRGCPFETEDSERAKEEGTVGAISNISQDQQTELRHIIDVSRDMDKRKSRGHDLTDIEELHRIFDDVPRLTKLEKEHPVALKKTRRILGVPVRRRRNTAQNSPAVEAVRLNQIQRISRRSFTCPNSEDIAVVISLVQDPLTNSIAAYNISTYSQLANYRPEPVTNTYDNLVDTLASTIRTIIDLRGPDGRPPTTQFYVFTAQEATSLQQHIISTALTLDENSPDAEAKQDALRLCVGALCEGASLLALSYQPVVLSGALDDFVNRPGLTKAELYRSLQRIGLPATGTIDQLRQRLTDKIDSLKAEGRRVAGLGGSPAELGLLPRIVVIKREVERLLALPVPGHWDLSDACTVMLDGYDCSSDGQIYEFYRKGNRVRMVAALEERSECVKKILDEMRQRAEGLLVNEARELLVHFMDLCQHVHLRKLFFMQQFEVLSRLQELWRARIDGCPEASVLEYRSTTNGVYFFNLISGSLDTTTEESKQNFFNFILVEDADPLPQSSDNLTFHVPPEALFYDLSLCGTILTKNSHATKLWSKQHQVVQEGLLIANLEGASSRNGSLEVTLKVWPTPSSNTMKLIRGTQYRLSPRYIDFNLTKVLSAILEIDLQCDSTDPNTIPFVRLISQPREYAQENSAWSVDLPGAQAMEKKDYSQLRQLRDLGSGAPNTAAGTLMLKQSQRKASQRILERRLAVVWGPPGTGKTHTITSSLLELVRINHRQGGKALVIFVAAMTNAAIDAFMSKLAKLEAEYRAIPDLDLDWLENLDVLRIRQASEHKGELTKRDPDLSIIYTGTVFQLNRLSKDAKDPVVDIVVLDEAGQLGLGSAALVMRALKSKGQVIMAGDSEQLAPILAAQYPQTDTYLFGSILDVVMHRTKSDSERAEELSAGPRARKKLGREDSILTASQETTIVQLTENFRLNEDLGNFISTIYLHKFQAQKEQKRRVATTLRDLSGIKSTSPLVTFSADFLAHIGKAMLGHSYSEMLRRPKTPFPTRLVKAASDNAGSESLARPISLALLRLQTKCTRPQQAGYETHVRAEAALAAALVHMIQHVCPEDTIFVATPHRVQRQAVQQALHATADFEQVQAPSYDVQVPPGGSVDEEQEDDDVFYDAEQSLGEPDIQPAAQKGKCLVDTIERLQGAEAAFVICLFSNTSGHGGLSALNFLLERRRLNVAISRAQTLCIMVTSDEVLHPPVALLADEQARKGFSFLRDYEKHAWAMSATVDLDPYLVDI